MKSKRVFILADIGLDETGGFHFGDEAMFYANLEWYTKKGYKVCASSRSISHKTHLFKESLDIYIKNITHYWVLWFFAYLYKFFKINFFPQYFKETINNLIKCNRLHVSGGGNINEIWPGHVLYRALMIHVAHLYQIPVYISGQTIGSFDNPLLKRITAQALRTAKMLGIRDKNISKKNLLSLEVSKSKIYYCPDDTLLMRVEHSSNKDQNHIKIGLSLHKFDNQSEYQEKLVRILNNIKQHIHEIHFVLIPHYYNQEENDDIGYMRFILNSAKISDYSSLNYSELIENKDFITQIGTINGYYSGLDIIISTRYHGIVFGHTHNVPVIGINLNEYYHQKNSTFLQELNSDQVKFLFDIDRINIQEFTKNIKQIIINKDQYVSDISIKISSLKKITKDFYNKIEHYDTK